MNVDQLITQTLIVIYGSQSAAKPSESWQIRQRLYPCAPWFVLELFKRCCKQETHKFVLYIAGSLYLHVCQFKSEASIYVFVINHNDPYQSAIRYK